MNDGDQGERALAIIMEFHHGRPLGGHVTPGFFVLTVNNFTHSFFTNFKVNFSRFLREFIRMTFFYTPPLLSFPRWTP